MGLFDAYDPATYQGAQGGLIDQLLPMLAAPTDPGPGFPPSPMDAQASAPAPQPQPAPGPQNAPIAVGDYQMPRVGSGFAPPAINPATGETAAPQPAAAPAPQPAPNPLDSVGDHLKASWQSMRHGGGLIGGLSGLVTGQRDDPQADALATQQAQLQKKYAALVAAGVPHQQAVLAAIDPEAGKTIVAQALGPQNVQSLGSGYVWNPRTGKAEKAYEPDDKWKVVQTGEDGLGHKTFMQQNPADGSFKPIPAAPGAANSIGLGDPTKTGAEYLATIPPQQAGIVRAMVEGRQAPPSSFALSKPYWQNMIAAAQQFDPTFDQTQWSARVAGQKDFNGGGKSSEMVRSVNQTLHHVNALIDSADALHNGNYPSMNWVGNKINEATGGGEPGAFVMNAHAVADEMGKVFKGANLSDSEIHAWADALSPNMSPAQQRAAIGKMTALLHGALDALDEKRVSSIGQVAADKAGPIIKPEGQAVLKRIDGWLKAGDGAGASGTAPTGVKWSVVQ